MCQNPERAVGRHVEQKFKSKFYVGVVADWDLDKDTNELIWRVSFDDGDEGDYNARELQKICAPRRTRNCTKMVQ
jgi:hypothetical protein